MKIKLIFVPALFVMCLGFLWNVSSAQTPPKPVVRQPAQAAPTPVPTPPPVAPAPAPAPPPAGPAGNPDGRVGLGNRIHRNEKTVYDTPQKDGKLRKIFDNVSYPDPAKFDQKKFFKANGIEDLRKLQENEDLAQIRKLAIAYCDAFAEYYTTEVNRDEKIDVGELFHGVCMPYRAAWAAVRPNETEVADHLATIPNPALIDSMDKLRTMVHYDYVKKFMRKGGGGDDSAYSASIFGKLGLPYRNSFLVTQILLLASFALTLVLAIKNLFG